jgi:hypothetical protein
MAHLFPAPAKRVGNANPSIDGSHAKHLHYPLFATRKFHGLRLACVFPVYLAFPACPVSQLSD